MRACFLVPDLSRSGGMDVVRGYAERLGAQLVAVGDGARPGGEWDVALATWWTTIPALAEVRAARRGVLMQGFDPLHYRPEEFVDQLAATAAVCAPFDVIAVSEWVADMVRAVRPSARCAVVAPGVDKDVFGGPPRTPGDGPLRILVEGQPSVWFKGVGDAVAATAAMTQPRHVTVVATDPAGARDVAADRVVGGLDPAAMAALYRETDVLVKLSRHEGLGLAPVEAFHAGVPCVIAPYGGDASYARHGDNALVVGFDDIPGTARALDRLAADRDLLARLSEGALRAAAQWPDLETASARLADALTALGPGSGDDAALGAVVRGAGQRRGELARLRESLAEHLQALEDVRADFERMSQAYRDASAQLEDVAAKLDEATSSRAYRLALRMRSVLPGR